ncbi:hypothetical protein N9N13_00950, partial [Opitutales bacterium]|nr:hypothetical protein [Opitutales bacterium]
VYTTGAALTDGPKLSWLRQDDNEESLTSADSKIYAAFNNVVYKRVASEPKYAIGAGTDHVAGDKVYRNGFVYEMKAGTTLAGLGSWNVAAPSTNAGDTLKEGVEHFKLLTTLSSHSDYKGNFSDAGFHNTVTTKFDPEGIAGAAIAAGDIVQGSAGNFFRAVVDRDVGTTVDWDELATDLPELTESLQPQLQLQQNGQTTFLIKLGLRAECMSLRVDLVIQRMLTWVKILITQYMIHPSTLLEKSMW